MNAYLWTMFVVGIINVVLYSLAQNDEIKINRNMAILGNVGFLIWVTILLFGGR